MFSSALKKSLLLLVALILFFCSYRVLSLHPIIGYDDQFLLNPVKKLGFSVFSNYFFYIKNGVIFDLQPIRDFSYLLDFRLMEIFPFYSHQLSNFFIWISFIFLLSRVLKNLRPDLDHPSHFFFILFIALSPVHASSYFWISGRKHLLSAFFMLAATFFSLEYFKKGQKSSLYYILFSYLFSVLSQPINVLWPIWFILFCFHYKILKKEFKFILILSFFSLLLLCLNYYYYTSVYLSITNGIDKFDPENVGNFGVPLLSLGRYFFLLLFPFDAIPLPHYIGSLQNLVGLFLLVLFCFFLYKKRQSNFPAIIHFLLFFLSLFPVTYRANRIFCSDTYLLFASMGFYFSLYSLLKRNSFSRFLFLGYSIFLFYSLYHYQDTFLSTKNFAAYSYQKDPSPDSALLLAKQYAVDGKNEEADKLILRVKTWEPFNLNLLSTAVFNVYHNPNLSDEIKINRLLKIRPESSLAHFYLSLLYASQNNSKLFLFYLEKAYSHPQSFISSVVSENEKYKACLFVVCSHLNVKRRCDEISNQYTPNVHYLVWDNKKYDQYKEKFLSMKNTFYYFND